jgi:hypothetical protein
MMIKGDPMKKMAWILALTVLAAAPPLWAEAGSGSRQQCPEGQTWENTLGQCTRGIGTDPAGNTTGDDSVTGTGTTATTGSL